MSVGYHLKQTSAETQAAIDKIIALQPGELDEIGIYNHDSLYWEEHSDFIPALGAFVVYTDEVKFKMGDGVKTVAELDFLDADLEQAISNLSTLLATKQDTLVSGENIKTVNGESLLGEGDIEVSPAAESLTYAELVALRDGGKLVPGQQYRITDYVATTVQTDTRSANHPFDIIVRAISENVLSEEARAAIHEGDTHFTEAGAKLEAWSVWYALDNDVLRFPWADATNGKGVVYRLIDEWDNDIPYDFKGIQFKRYYVTAIASAYADTLAPLVGLPIALAGSGSKGLVAGNEFKWYYTFSRLGDTWAEEVTDGSLEGKEAVVGTVITSNRYDSKGARALNNTIFADGQVSYLFMKELSNDTNAGPEPMSLNSRFDGDSMINNFVLGYTAYIYTLAQFRRNTIIGAFRHSTILSEFQDNTLLFDRDSVANSFGNFCTGNVIRAKSNFSYNTFGDYTQKNHISLNQMQSCCAKALFYSNTITGDALGNDDFGVNFQTNTLTNCRMVSVQFSGQFNICQFDGRFACCSFKSITSNVRFVGGSGSSNFAGVDVSGSIRGSSNDVILISASQFIVDSISSTTRRIFLEGDANGNLVATWYADGKRVGITKAPSDADWSPLPDVVEANPIVPSGTTPTELQGLKIGSSYYSIENEESVFWATYGTTTGAEIDAAIAEGKTVYCKYGSASSWSIYRLVSRHYLGYEFSCLEGNENYRLCLNRNGTWSTEYTYLIDTDSVYIAKEYTYVTYSELVEMRDNWNLTRGAYYCITDYVTTTSDPESRSLAHPFYIIVQALGNGEISEEAFAARALNTLDDYFSGTNFAAWKIWYCLDNDTSRFTWADTVNGKGVIYRMIDEWNNDLPYDFKNIQFKRYVVASVNATYTDALTPLIGLPIALSGTRSKGLVAGTDFKWYFTFSRLGDAWTDDVTDGSLEGGRAAHSVVFAPNTDDTRASRLCHNVFADGAASFNFMKTLNANTNAGPNSICYDSKFKGDACEDNTVIGYIYGGDISSDFCSNTIVGAFRVMNVGGAMMNNTMLFDRDALCLSFGHMCSDNIIRVTLAQYCHFGHYFRRNYIFLSNTLSSSTFGDSIYDNVIKGEQIQAVRCGNLCIRNTFTNINMSASQIEGQFNDNELIGRFRECFIGAITSWCIFAGGTGNDFFSNVDVRGNIRGASGSELRIESNNFITADISGVKRHISLEGDTNGNLVATWYSAGKRVGIYKAPSDADWSPLPEAYFKPSGGIPASDLASGVIPDVSNFITNTVDDLVNYYLKSETYTKAEVAALIGAIQQFHYEVYASTSAVTSPASNVLYLIGPTGQGSDKYEEYVYPNATTGWVKIGDTSIDLTPYVTTTALNTALANYTTTADLTTLLAGKQDNLIVEVGGLERNNVSGTGSITITGTRGQFPRVTKAGTYTVTTKMQSTTQSYGLAVTFGSNSYTLNTTNGVINDERELTLAANAAWSGAVIGAVAGNTYIYVSVVGEGAVTALSNVAVSGSYNDLSDRPTIPSVPAISTDIAADASSDSKTASPKAVANYVDATAVLGPLDNDIFGRTANEELTIKNGGITKAKLATAVQNELIPSGGSAGQVLKKTSATDFDAAWANESAGVEYFDATYDVTTGAELKAAAAAGKVLRVLDDGAIYQLGYWGISGTPETWQNEDLEAVFYHIDDSGNAQFTGTIRVATEGQNTTWSRREVTNVDYFDAIYNVTTGAEIKAAVAAGKTLRVIDDGQVYQLSYWALNGTPEVWQDFDASFSCVESFIWETSYIHTIYVRSDGPNITQWSREDYEIGGGSSDAVLYTQQSLTDAQKAQARENIGTIAEGVEETTVVDVEWGTLPSGGTKGQTLVKQSAMDNDAVWGDAFKYGVISQTQTWIGSASTGYDYTMSDLVYGYIPQANIDLYTAAGATFNATTGYFELNGLTDISYEEMKVIYAKSFPLKARVFLDMALSGYQTQTRTNFPIWDNSFTSYGSVATQGQNLQGVCSYNSTIEVFAFYNLGNTDTGLKNNKSLASIQYAFGTLAENASTQGSRLKKVIGVLNIGGITSTYRAFWNAINLESIQIKQAKAAIDFSQSSRLSVESILYLINNSTTTSFTVTLHPTAYARAIADTDVQAALQAHTNVTLASA